MQGYIISALLFTTLCGAGYFYYNSTQNRITELTQANAKLDENNKQLTAANQQNVDTIDQLQASYEVVQQQFSQIQSEFQVIRSQNEALRERLSDHDIGMLAFSKPKLVENAINNASRQTNRCFELLTGAPLNSEEKKAKNEREFNTECPWLYYELVNP